MKKLILSGVAACVLAAAGFAAPARSQPMPVYNWSGFYIGAHAGYAWGKKDWFDGTDDFNFGAHAVSGVLAGGQVGFNWQTSNWVLGIEGQASWADAKGSHLSPDFPGISFHTQVDRLGTIAGRLGYAWDRVLVYAKGGFAFAHDKHQIADGGIPYVSGDTTRWGWMAGTGIEVALGGNWSVKGEYNYMDFGKKTVTIPPVIPGDLPELQSIVQQIHVVKFGINYRFGG